MNVKSAHMVFEDYRAGNNTLLNCFKKYPTLYQKYDKLLGILTRIDTLFCTSSNQQEDVQNKKKLHKLWKNLESFFLCILKGT